MSKAGQLSMFGDEAVDAASLVAIGATRTSLTKAQQAFNRLVAKIGRQREVLVQWQDFVAGRYAQRVAIELEPLHAELSDSQRQMARLIDELLTSPPRGEKHSRQQKARLELVLQGLIDSLLESGPDPEMEALHDKHSDTTRDELRQAELEMTQAFLGGVLGRDAMKGHGATSAEELFEHARNKLRADAQRQAGEREARRDARSRKRGGPTQAQQADDKNEQAAKEASQSVREIYRKLASALHPDREPDAAERERKTRLMQRANQCYESDDLLGLLSLQIETLQIDPDRIADVPDERLTRYNHVLREQLVRLDAELASCIAPFRMMLGLAPWDPNVTPQRVEAELERQLADMRVALTQLHGDLVAFRDPKLRRARLKAILSDDDGSDAELIEDDITSLLAALGGAPSEAPSEAPGNSRRRRRR